MNSLPGEPCPSCGTGLLHPQRIDYTVTVTGDVKVTVTGLLVDACEHCGEVMLPAESVRIVDAAIAEQTEQLTPRELERIRERFEVDQTGMSEILGLGGKTYHRWERGNQVASRSMGYYLRVLEEFPEAFAWLRNRKWRSRNRVAAVPTEIRFEDSFPDLATLAATTTSPGGGSPARALSRVNRALALFTRPR